MALRQPEGGSLVILSWHGMAWHSLCVRSRAYDFSQAVVRLGWELCSGAATTTAGLTGST
jgi:hypothetical protein